MSKVYQVVPSNRKTLFLRNLETILTNHEVMCECQTKTFRDNTCFEILHLLESFISDEKNESNKLMMNEFKNQSLITRFLNDRRKLSVDHSH